MTVSIYLDERYDRTPDGSIWTRGPQSYQFWKRYLAVFEQVRIVARVQEIPLLTTQAMRVNGPGVECFPVPYYVGPAQFLWQASSIRRAVRQSMGPTDAVIMRVSSMLANCLEPELYAAGRPFGLEVIGDPHDVFAPGAVKHPMRPFFRWWFARSLRRQCLRAAGVSYVTARTLQQKYPCSSSSVGISDVDLDSYAFAAGREPFVAQYSSVELADGDILQQTRTAPGSRPRNALRIVTVGSLEQPYKGVDVLIRAVAKCIAAGLTMSLTVVGDGRYRASLEELATGLGIRDAVHLMGQLPSQRHVRDVLDKSDVFVLASRTEGLPRAMLEAMARALPCIGTRVGGIPELLDGDDLVDSDDAEGLASKLRDLAADPARMGRMSGRNLEVASGYRAEILDAHRRRFFEHIRQVTAEWADCSPDQRERRAS